MIIDEFTGRILEGRRWSEGLHQAVEAKEGVRVQEENQTLATITLQNYFRLYDKLAGMTGTALTEATEFMKIYELAVVEIPTNRPMVRADHNDQIYKTKDGKWEAVVSEIDGAPRDGPAGPRRHDLGRGLRDALRASCKRAGIEHAVLNAKPEYAEREGETIAEAGPPGAVTIATNMAGRGVDIKLGGNPEHLAAAASCASSASSPATRATRRRCEHADRRSSRRRSQAEARRGARGRRPLHLRHRAPRVAPHRQPAARPLRPPGRPRRVALLPLRRGRPRPPVRRRPHLQDPRPPRRRSTRRATRSRSRRRCSRKQIENAQKKVEEQNFLIRKRVLEYDDVMNEQRRVVYKYRERDPRGPRHVRRRPRGARRASSSRLVDEYTPGDVVEDWDLDGLVTPARADLARRASTLDELDAARRSTARSSPRR